MDPPLAKFREFYRQPRTSQQDRILLLTDCPQELYLNFQRTLLVFSLGQSRRLFRVLRLRCKRRSQTLGPPLVTARTVHEYFLSVHHII
ncbi:hypothetical protein V1523DRAFT_411624 [Lipomyces doorenjongii]